MGVGGAEELTEDGVVTGEVVTVGTGSTVVIGGAGGMTKVVVAMIDTGMTVTVALAGSEVPTRPVQVMESVVSAVGETVMVFAVPFVVKLVPVQEVALVER